MSTVITVENLGKKYTLQHQQREQYTALRDVITNGVRNLSKKILSPFTPHSSPLTASQEDFWALKDVSFEVKQGDRVGIIGRNGAGKSTLLKILSRITEPTTGSIRIKGRVASLLEVGTGFHPELTGRENIFLNGAILGMGRAEIRKKFDEIVDFAEIEKFLDTPVKRYSSGMYVRLAFAVAAHLEPEILIVDEVLAVGDAQFQAKCLEKMKRVSASGRTVMFVSHNLGVVSSFCNHSILISDGHVKSQGETGTVIAEYMKQCQTVHAVGADLTFCYPYMYNEFFMPLKIELLSAGCYTNVVGMGSNLEVVIHYYRKKLTKYLKLGIHIVDSLGTVISVLSPNQQYPNFISSLKNIGTISCKVPCLNLMSGDYFLNIHFEIPGFTEAYCLEKTTDLHIVDNDIYGTGVIPSSVHGVVVFIADWSF
ncbi:MAG: polysaccharide ABC transporter ATP-binding protein [Desulfuromonadaceae bacterium]|nr:polysaccharide ABC transporter ATP-binding protein [Desulfuromonadaceae bacterium]